MTTIAEQWNARAVGRPTGTAGIVRAATETTECQGLGIQMNTRIGGSVVDWIGCYKLLFRFFIIYYYIFFSSLRTRVHTHTHTQYTTSTRNPFLKTYNDDWSRSIGKCQSCFSRSRPERPTRTRVRDGLRPVPSAESPFHNGPVAHSIPVGPMTTKRWCHTRTHKHRHTHTIYTKYTI